jgi:3-hydroxyacyl-[acyl-carrier-protein] dehydratase
MRWLFTDQILKCSPGESIVTAKCFSGSEPFFKNHFPDFPIVPGVLQIEMIVNASFLCIRLFRPDCQAFLALVKKAKFYHPIRPGEFCETKISSVTLLEHRARAKGIICASGRKVAEAEIYLSINKLAGTSARLGDQLIKQWKEKSSANSR